ncbi:MAG: hypothetical protein JO064_06225 [Actinobacteria bacterium]|nr:hypothetical protein [Actinomycetota bacterium]MBV8597222.1 hypothetical protein [Actinomycetota bacterium]
MRAALIAAALAAAVAVGSARAAQTLVIYSVATHEQFLNHSDDRARGVGNNPFGSFKDSTGPSGKETAGNGPFAGDRSIFTFAVFGTDGVQNPIGSATFACEYVFDKNAFCNAVYVLPGGRLLGTGYFNFNAKTFSVSITGGTGKYAGAIGQLDASAAKRNHEQKLTIALR